VSAPNPPRRGLVLGAGGVLGFAWAVGALTALQEQESFDCRDADMLIGTSAGSITAALLACGVPVDAMVRHQSGVPAPGDPVINYNHDAESTGPLPPRPAFSLGSPSLLAHSARHPLTVTPLAALSSVVPIGRGSLDSITGIIAGVLRDRPGAQSPSSGSAAAASRTGSASGRAAPGGSSHGGSAQAGESAGGGRPGGAPKRRVKASEDLGDALAEVAEEAARPGPPPLDDDGPAAKTGDETGAEWAPHPSLWVVAMDYDTGKRVAFGRDGAPQARLEAAVAASCAIPGWYAPITIGGRRYVDGGACSSTSLDLFAGQGLDEVFVVAPMVSFAYDSPTGMAARLERRVRRAISRRLLREAEKVQAAGTRVTMLGPGPEDLEAIGANLMDASRRDSVLQVSLRTSAEALRRGADPYALDDGDSTVAS
jgi:NTE family protein